MTEAQAAEIIAQGVQVLAALAYLKEGVVYNAVLLACVLGGIGVLVGLRFWSIARDAANRSGFWGAILLGFLSTGVQAGDWDTWNSGRSANEQLTQCVWEARNYQYPTSPYSDYYGWAYGQYFYSRTFDEHLRITHNINCGVTLNGTYTNWSAKVTSCGGIPPEQGTYTTLGNKGINQDTQLMWFLSLNNDSAADYKAYAEFIAAADLAQPQAIPAGCCSGPPAFPPPNGGTWACMGFVWDRQIANVNVTVACGSVTVTGNGMYRSTYWNPWSGQVPGQWAQGDIPGCLGSGPCAIPGPCGLPGADCYDGLGCVERAAVAAACAGGLNCGSGTLECWIATNTACPGYDCNGGGGCENPPPNDGDCDGCPDAYDNPDGTCDVCMVEFGDGMTTDSDCDGCADILEEQGLCTGCNNPNAIPSETDSDCDGCPDVQENPDGTCQEGDCEGDEDCDGCPDAEEGNPDSDNEACDGPCTTAEGKTDADCDDCPDDIDPNTNEKTDPDKCNACQDKGGDKDKDGCCDDEDTDTEKKNEKCENCEVKIITKMNEFRERIGDKFPVFGPDELLLASGQVPTYMFEVDTTKYAIGNAAGDFVKVTWAGTVTQGQTWQPFVNFFTYWKNTLAEVRKLLTYVIWITTFLQCWRMVGSIMGGVD